MNTNDKTIDELMDAANTEQGYKADYIANVGEFVFADDGAMIVNGNFGGVLAAQAYPTDHALSQVFTKLGVAAFGKGGRGLPAEFMRAIPKDWMALNLNEAIKRMPSKSGWTMRTYQTAEMPVASARAVMDKSYYDFDNTDMLTILHKVLTDKPVDHRITGQSFVHADSMRVGVLMGYKKERPDSGGNDAWMWGIGLKNDEVGKGGGGAYAVLKRTSCDNSIVVDVDGFNYAFRHWARLEATRARYKTEMAIAIANILPHAEQIIEDMIESSYQELPDFSELVKGCSILNSWGDNLTGHIWEGAEGQHTRGGLINGITHAAKFAETPEDRFDMERFGGAILVTPDSVFGQASEALRYEKEQAKEQARAARAIPQGRLRR